MNTREILKEFAKGCSNGYDCDECLDAAVMAIRADIVPQWRPIETAPRDGTGFLVFERISEKHHTLSVCVWENGSEGEGPYMVIFHEKSNQPMLAATHWMPLPNPPEDK